MSFICGILTNNLLNPGEAVHSMMLSMHGWSPDNAGLAIVGSQSFKHYMCSSGRHSTVTQWLNDTETQHQVTNVRSAQIALGHLMLWNVPESLTELQPLADEAEQVYITADCRIDNREELITTLNLNKEIAHSKPDSWFILQAYFRWRTQTAEHLLGDFAFAIWDQRLQQWYAARDVMGIRPFFYTRNDQFFAFSSNLRALHALIGKNEDSRWVENIMQGNVPLSNATQYKDIFRLPASQALSITQNELKTWTYFSFDYETELKYSTDAAYLSEFSQVLSQSVKSRMRSAYPVGAEFSGGIDSTLVVFDAWKQSKLNQQSFATFAHVLPHGSALEYRNKMGDRTRIEKVCEAMQLPKPYFFTGENRLFFDDMEQQLRFTGEVPPTHFAMYSDGIYEAAQHQHVRTMLSGFGGDQTISYSGKGCVNELLRKCDLLAYSRYCYTKAQGQWVPYSKRLVKNILLYFKNNYSIKEDQHRMLFNWYTQFRTVDQNLLAARYSITYTYPLLDTRLIQFGLSLPVRFYTSASARSIAQRYLQANQFPQNIVLKSGMYAPSVRSRIENDSAKLLQLMQTVQPGTNFEGDNLYELYRQHSKKIITNIKYNKL